MKGLPPDNDSEGLVPESPKTDVGYRSLQTRPSSVRPLMASGPTTGAMYMVYSSAKRTTISGQLTHKLHHTYAIWDLAPVKMSASGNEPPAPMLASFDWFMPEDNI